LSRREVSSLYLNYVNAKVKPDLGQLRYMGTGSYIHFYTDNYDVLMNTPKYQV